MISEFASERLLIARPVISASEMSYWLAISLSVSALRTVWRTPFWLGIRSFWPSVSSSESTTSGLLLCSMSLKPSTSPSVSPKRRAMPLSVSPAWTV